MRFTRFGLLFSLLLLSCSVCAQQIASSPQAPPQPTKDPQSLAFLEQAILTMGGTVSASQPIGVIAQGALTASPAGISGSVLWKNSGAEFRYEQPSPNGSSALVSGHGKPAIIDGGKVTGRLIPLTVGVFPAHLPATVLVSELNNPNLRLDALQHVTVDGAAAIKISTEDETDNLSAKVTKQDWYFDPTTMLPFRVDYLTTNINNLEDIAKITAVLSDYRLVSGLLVPFHVVSFFNGHQIADVTLNNVQLNVSIPNSDFDAPTISSGGVR